MISSDWCTCATCSCPHLKAEPCPNPGCDSRGDLPPEIIARRKQEAEEATNRAEVWRIRERMSR